MGCSSSKRAEVAAVDVYRPAPASFAVFDINSIREPWIIVDPNAPREKPNHVPAQILDKLNSLEAAEDSPAPPHSWEEVSKALEDLKPTFQPNPLKPGPIQPPPPAHDVTTPLNKQSGNNSTTNNYNTPRKSLSFHTVEELDAKMSSKSATPRLGKTESMRIESRVESRPLADAGAGGGIKPVKENIFVVRDRLEREKEGKVAKFERIMASKRDPLREFLEKCPPGGENSIVIYTTSLRGVRRTYDECSKVRAILELHGVVNDERDVSLHGEFLNELKELLGEKEGATGTTTMVVPRVFVKGRYLGGAEEVVELNESGQLGRILSHSGVERGVGRQACEGCGGARFIPCLKCGGSCRVVVAAAMGEGGDRKERCPKCNENGLVLCPACH